MKLRLVVGVSLDIREIDSYACRISTRYQTFQVCSNSQNNNSLRVKPGSHCYHGGYNQPIGIEHSLVKIFYLDNRSNRSKK